ncbi:protein CASP-like [Dysidea avara]|uniref:protein CASP-like n=1 Tax=Dysidea avara TaxID=196820 RepID=UPI003334516A
MASTNTFTNLLQFWKQFDLPEFHKQLEATATEIANRQDESDTSRKRLVEQSKEFKKTTTEDVRKAAGPLLKAFQAEIDALSKRSKVAETACLNLYRKLIDVPDSIPVLQQAISIQQKLITMQDRDIENKQLRETLEEYKSEFAEVKNQEVTINRLREQLRSHENTLQEKAAAMVRTREEQLVREYSEQEKQLQEVVESFKDKLSQSESKVVTLTAALESTQAELFDLKNKFDEESTAKAAEIDLLATDLERANQRVITMERELEEAKQIQRTQSPPSWQNFAAAGEITANETREHEASELMEQLQNAQRELARVKEQGNVQIEQLQQQLEVKNSALQTLESTLANQKDYEEIRRELDVIRSVEFSSGSCDSTDTSQPLEVLLLEKNKMLQSEYTATKQLLGQQQERYSALQAEHSQLSERYHQSEKLVSQLESDLSLVRPLLPPRDGDTDVTGTTTKELLADVLSMTDHQPSSDSLLSIVTSQRERFKERNSQLEEDCGQLHNSNRLLRQEADMLRADNVKLYEKVKFLQCYPSNSSRGVVDDDVVKRYSSDYENNLDPFAAFSSKERQRKYMNLSGPDKATLVLGRFILSNKVARMIAFVYTVLLHLLVFMVLFRLANTVSCSRDVSAELVQKFTEHLQVEHKGEGLDEIIGLIRGEHNLNPLPG